MKKVNSAHEAGTVCRQHLFRDRFVYRDFFCYGVYRVFFRRFRWGRTGLTAVVVGLLFLLVIFLSPLAGWCRDMPQLAR